MATDWQGARRRAIAGYRTMASRYSADSSRDSAATRAAFSSYFRAM